MLPRRRKAYASEVSLFKQVVLAVAYACILASCAQGTFKASSFRRTVTTYIEVTANVPSEAMVGDKVIGITPVSVPFNYEEEVDRQVKNANYWETNPGTAAALTILSFGFYLPFSFIPAEPSSDAHPTGRFVNNRITLRLTAQGFEPLEHTVEAHGESKIVLSLLLKPKEN